MGVSGMGRSAVSRTISVPLFCEQSSDRRREHELWLCKRCVEGTVVGTDGYKQYIPGVRRGYLPVKENKAQLAIFVPAAASLVRDKIEVRSKILKEKQKLEIEF